VPELYIPVVSLPPATMPTRPPEGDPEPPARPPVTRDLAELVPAFRERVERMLRALEAADWRPMVWETLRTPERGRWLRASGRSRNGHLSMHCHRAAVDVICRLHRWDCDERGCGFFDALGAAAEAERLCWGGRWRTFVDRPHVQAVSTRKQRAVRAGADVALLMRRI
jgi:hypothetical protein